MVESKNNRNSGGRGVVPSWVKRAGAIIAIVATAATIFTGIFALILQVRGVVVEVEQERTKRSEADRAKAEAQLKDTMKKLEIEQEISRREELRKDTEQAKGQREIAAAERERQLRVEEEKLRREQELFQKITQLVESDKPALGTLLYLSHFISFYGHPEYEEFIMTALTTRAEKPESAWEVRLIFKVLNQLETNMFSPIIDLNRFAFKRYQESLISLFQKRLTSAIGGYRHNEHLAYILLQYHIKPTLNSAHFVDPSVQELILLEYALRLFQDLGERRALRQIAKPTEETEGEDILRQRLLVCSEIINQSKIFIGNRLHRTIGQVDLSKTYLAGLRVKGDCITSHVLFDNAIVFRLDHPKFDFQENEDRLLGVSERLRKRIAHAYQCLENPEAFKSCVERKK